MYVVKQKEGESAGGISNWLFFCLKRMYNLCGKREMEDLAFI